MIRKAVIPAAGLGTRFLPATKAQPKEMLPIVDKPAIQFVVEEVLNAGISDILIITGRGKRAIEDHFDRAFELEYYLEKAGKLDLLDEVGTIAGMGRIHFIRQGTPAGLGHAVLQAKEHVGDEPFIVLLGDDILEGDPYCIGEMISIYEERKCSSVAVQKVLKEEAKNYGIVRVEKKKDDLFKVLQVEEKPPVAPPEFIIDDKFVLAIMGRYVLTPEIFTELENVTPDKFGELQLTHGLERLLNTKPIYAHLHEGLRWDIGSKLGFLKATVDYALSIDEIRDDFIEYLKGKI